ncbi:MAG: box helicase [Patescibacteria group bacterium]|nr:ATP-dependent helicase DeaD [Patescibacteria group bacterium]MDQ5968865.1 box helicase [Patescibacteria group bacterium]
METRTNNSPQGRVFRKPNFKSGGRSHGGFSRNTRGGYSSHAPVSRGKRVGFGRGKSTQIDPSRFINKAVAVTPASVFVPENQFVDFAIDARLKANIIAKGYVLPTPIQDKAIPAVLSGADVVGIANTGTGKTAAFLIPLIHKILTQPKENVLIVVPTRELAIQIEQELQGFITGMKLYATCVVGGSPIGKQIRDLKYRNEFVIGTPGRIKDLIERKVLNLAFFKTVVLDEADRMLDMGFVNDMRFMMAQMPRDRHTLFFSATLSPEIQGLIKEFLCDPIMISVKTQDTSKNVDQDVIRLKAGDDKLDVLHKLLTQKEFNKVLIFGRTKHGVEKLSKNLTQRGFMAEAIHGNKNQSGRQRALKLFKENRVQILVATDVAARGLDINNVSHVINFDIPATYEDYVHRIGRTGRAGKMGTALTFIA